MTARFDITAADAGLVARLQALPGRLTDTGKRAVTAVTEQAGEEVADRVAAANRIPRAVVFAPTGKKGPRVFVRLPKRSKSTSGSVWIGGKPIPAEYLGTAVQTAAGVQVGPYFYDGAFLARMRNGHVGVFERETRLARHSRGRPVHWQPNLPIVHLAESLDFAGPVRRVQALIPARLEAAVRAELERRADG